MTNYETHNIKGEVQQSPARQMVATSAMTSI